MELNAQVNTFSNGMNLDADVSVIPEGQYRYAENIRLLTNDNGTTGILQNIESIKKYEGGIPMDETILGTAITRLYDPIKDSTVECGIILTKDGVDNKLYKITGFETNKIVSEIITKGKLGITKQVSIVTNYESDKVSNVYICDGTTPIKVINIVDDDLKDETGNIVYVTDPTKFDITPGCILFPLLLTKTINGALPAGAVQYCYQLFNLHGSETTTAALSEVIPITKHDGNTVSSKVAGQLKGELSTRGCLLKAKFINDGRFDRARIFSIVYLDNISIPDIYIINEIEIPTEKNNFVEFIYNDTGASFLSKITIDEFNAMIPNEFNAKSIEKLGNRLFASNVQELTWDVDFDARAYRCNIVGNVKLDSSNQSNVIEGTLQSDGSIIDSLNNEIVVPLEHDCINPSNVDVMQPMEYEYYFDEDGNKIRGGIGKNLSYRFIYTQLINSDTIVTENKLSDDLSLFSNRDAKFLNVYYENGTIATVHNVSESNGPATVIPNYSDPFVCSHYLGYQRDEIYRFGIIFYNNKNIPSPVHWIGDIRMPGIKDAENKDSLIYPFHTGKKVDYYDREDDYRELVSYALGIEFKLKGLPEGATAYEIVRCDRNEMDRTVVTQGILGTLFKFTDWSKEEYNIGSNDTRPAPLFTMVQTFRTKTLHNENYDYDDQHVAVSGYFEFVSPEICISKDSIIGNIQNNELQPLYTVDSSTSNENVAIPQSKIYNIAENELVQNDPLFGYVEDNDGVYYLNTGHAGSNDYNGDYYGYAGVFKYYNINNNDNLTVSSTSYNIEDAVISNILPYMIKLDDAKSYALYIENKVYVNTSIIGYRLFSNHGINAVLHVSEDYNPYITNATSAVDFSTAIIANVKQNTIPYGGNTYISRQNSVYNSCGCFSTSTTTGVKCYGGDTYLGVLDYLNTSVVQQEKDLNKERRSRFCCVCYIPLESQINLNLRSDDSYHREVSDGLGPNLIQNEPVVMPNGWVQKKPYYEYNPVYSTTSGSKQYVAKSIYAEDNQINQNRIVVSELKTNNEITDSWTKFKFANYLDVDSLYGLITNLKSFNNKLYYWLDNAVGIASVNDRSLITDTNQAMLVLGTGGILSRFDYISTMNGSSIVNDKSIIKSANAVYWYDFDKNEICSLTNGIVPLSKIKGVQSYLNTLSKSVKENAVSFYDKKYNEVWFKLYDKSLIYNEQLQQFTSFYTHLPNWFFPFSDKLVSIKKDNTFYLHNVYQISDEQKDEKISKIQFVVNKDIANTKTFDNVLFSAELIDNEKATAPIINNICFSTKTQKTDNITIEDIELREDNYRFAIPRESIDDYSFAKLANKSYLGRMRGKYLICDYTFDCNNNREFKLPYVKTTYRYSIL